MKQPVLIIIKPDGINRQLAGHVFSAFAETGLKMVALSLKRPTREKAEEHYKHLNKEPFFERQVSFFIGDGKKDKELIFIIYYGDNAIKTARKIAGATNPEEASPSSLRGRYGRITTKGVYENVVHVSSDKAEAQREIKLWFNPDEIRKEIYPSKIKKTGLKKQREWL